MMHQQLKTYLEQTGLSQSNAAKALGVTKPVLNAYLQNKYQGSAATIAEIDEKVAAFLRQQQEKAEIKKLEIPFVATETAERALGFLNMTHHFGKLGIFYGGAGTGKTTTLNEYLARNPQCVLIEPDTGFTTRVLLQELCRKLNVSDKGNIHEMTERVVECLKGSGRLLMIDEAEWLPLRALETVRRIQDKSQCGVALAGTLQLLINLRGAKGELKQLYSRVFTKCDFGERIVDADLRQIAAEVLMTNDDKVLDKIMQTAQGNVRKLENLLMLIVHLMQQNRNNPNFKGVNVQLAEHADKYLMH
ncbi:AAA family ATPase [Kingella kingae]|uniref:AAA family ATPase n=1 Tax=Kingella kingae TaxID=504 RepID=UPI001E56CDBC|nr:AAA family ATPase [Kingella kingae]